MMVTMTMMMTIVTAMLVVAMIEMVR